MDVQPLIVMSLGLFTILAIVTLSISYLAYKHKLKNSEQPATVGVSHQQSRTSLNLMNSQNSMREPSYPQLQKAANRKAESVIRPKVEYKQINESESKMFSIDKTVKRYNVYKTNTNWENERKDFRKHYMGKTKITDDNVFDFYLDD